MWRPTDNLTVIGFVLTGAGGAALLGVDFGVLAVDDTPYLRLSDDTFLSQPGGQQFLQFILETFLLTVGNLHASRLSFLHAFCPFIFATAILSSFLRVSLLI